MRNLLFVFLFFISGVANAQIKLQPQPREVWWGTDAYLLERKMSTAAAAPRKVINKTYDTQLLDDGYRLTVDSTGVQVTANTYNGISNGLRILDQIAKQMVHSDYMVRFVHCRIADYPQYNYRGMHLDVSRHFFSKEVVKQYIDELAKNRLNYFHWHLTDDQGWRIEIKKYPLLTQVGAWRIEKDGTKYGGFYTQDDVREIVSYAAEKGVTVIPEIEMPGHSSAAVAAYPWLSCAGKQIAVSNTWGIKKDIYCPTDSTFAFLKHVLDEVSALFPGPYIHIGGDEVPKAQWKKSAAVKQLMKEKKLKNYEQVQHYFMHQMESYLLTKGKRSIGWGEVVRGGLSDSMIVMSWRGKGAGKRAAKKGNNVIMAPRFSCYYDYPQSRKEKKAAWWMTYLPVEKVYKFNPGVKSARVNGKILGAEATLWTEYVADENKLWNQLKPRIQAFGQNLWYGNSDWDGFKKKIGE